MSLQSLEGNLVLEYWNNMRRRLKIALNMLITANYFVGLKWWHQKAVTGKSLVMKIKNSVLYLFLFFLVIIILMGNKLSTTSHLLFPLFVGYLVSKLMSTEAENTYQLYACALAMCLNGLIGGLGVHQQDYRCEILGIKIASALRGLAYHKVGTILRLAPFTHLKKIR